MKVKDICKELFEKDVYTQDDIAFLDHELSGMRFYHYEFSEDLDKPIKRVTVDGKEEYRVYCRAARTIPAVRTDFKWHYIDVRPFILEIPDRGRSIVMEGTTEFLWEKDISEVDVDPDTSIPPDYEMTMGEELPAAKLRDKGWKGLAGDKLHYADNHEINREDMPCFRVADALASHERKIREEKAAARPKPIDPEKLRIRKAKIPVDYSNRIERMHHNMMSSCYNPKFPRYKNFGGKGITVDFINCKDFKEYVLKTFSTADFSTNTIGRIDETKSFCRDNLCLVPLRPSNQCRKKQ
jgi:hypothetical protein